MRKTIATVALLITAMIVPSTAGTATAAPRTDKKHTVAPGETLSEIASEYGTSYRHLASVNNLPNPDFIQVGQHIRTTAKNQKPTPSATPKASKPTKTEPRNSSETDARNEISRRESGGDYNAVNPSSGAYGRWQCMPSVHDCPTDPAAQDAWAENYVLGRYGSWVAALAFHNANGYY